MLANFIGIRHFTESTQVHNWGDPAMIDRGLLLMLDLLVDVVGVPAIVTSGYRPQSMGSQHALGLACDVMFPSYTGSLRDLYLKAEQIDFKGLGVYPDWHYAGNTIGGLHLDERLGKRARWMGVLMDGKQQYIALNAENLKKYGVV